MKTTKKILSVFLALLMIISIIPMSSITASAATAIKTQNEAVTWLNAQQDKTYNFDGAYGTQCTEFVKAYVNYLMTGDPWQNCGYAVDYNGRDVWKSSFWKNNGWTVYENTIDFMPQPGDIFCAGLSSYGHTGVVISSDIYTAKIAEANGRDSIVDNGDPVWIRTISWKSSTTDSPYGATHFIRPNFKNANVPTTGISLNPTSFSLEAGQTKNLTATVTPSNATDKSVTWSSSNTNVAIVSSSGVVLAKAGGTCTITATNSGGQKATATVNVTSGSLKICVDGNSNNQYWNLTLGGTESTNCYLSINEYYGNSIKYSYSTNNSNVSCSLGNVNSSNQAPFSVYANSKGETTITISVKDATSGTVLDTINVYVTVDAKTYTVNYNANGGTGAPDGQIKYHNQNLTLSSIKPTRTGYTFLGWSTSSTATSATYSAGGSFTSNANTTLYAVWQKNAVAEPEIHVSSTSVNLTLGETENIDIYAWATDIAVKYTLRYEIKDTNLVTCSWGGWTNDKRCPLTITAKSKGATTVTILLMDYETQAVLDSVTVTVNVGVSENFVDFSIKDPSTTTIRYKDGIALHIDGYIPDGARVEWAIDSNAFDGGTYDNGMSCLLVSQNNGYATVIATLYDANGNVIATDSVELRSNAGFFQKIGGFFRSLFGTTTVYDA